MDNNLQNSAPNGTIFGVKKEIFIYFCIVALTAFALGISDRVFSNYFKEVYNVTTAQRGFIEFPRELPGLLCVVVMSVLSFLGNIRIAMVSQVLSIIGLVFLGFITPSFGVMLIFLFINSLGMHMFFPLQDSIGISLAKQDQMGKRMGQYKGVSIAFTMLSGIFVLIGFRTGFLSFDTPIKVIFLISGIILVVVLGLFAYLNKMISVPVSQNKVRFLFRKEYIYYYILAIMNGAQKQIMFVFGPWVLIELLGKKADTIALLAIIGSFIGIFFTPMIGRWADKFGIKKILYLDALSYIFVYFAYGCLSFGYSSGRLALVGIPVLFSYALYVMDNMSMQLGMMKVVYLQRIARDNSEITPTLSLGISMDHVVSIICGVLGGLVWKAWGPQYIFFLAGAFSFVNLFVAAKVHVGANKPLPLE